MMQKAHRVPRSHYTHSPPQSKRSVSETTSGTREMSTENTQMPPITSRERDLVQRVLSGWIKALCLERGGREMVLGGGEYE